MTELILTQKTTMTSIELAEMLGYEKKEIHRKIKSKFSSELVGGLITPSLDSRGYVNSYLLPEIESKMLVAVCNTNYLREITEYWVNKGRNAPAIPQSFSEALQLAADQAKTIENQKISLDVKDDVILATNKANIEAGNIKVREFCKSIDFVDVGQNAMFQWLRDSGYIMKSNEPYQQHVKRGLFAWKPSEDEINGKVRYTLMITPRGKAILSVKYMNYVDSE